MNKALKIQTCPTCGSRKIVSLQCFEKAFIKSLPTSLCQREEKYIPLWKRGIEGDLRYYDILIRPLFQKTKVFRKIKKIRKNLTSSFAGQTYTVPLLEFYECPHCGEKVYDRDAMGRIEMVSPAFSKPCQKFQRGIEPRPPGWNPELFEKSNPAAAAGPEGATGHYF